MQTNDPAAAAPELGPLSNPLEVFGAYDAKTTTLDVGELKALGPVMCDGSVYDPGKPHLLVTLENHTVEGFEDDEYSFDATCNRIISTVSTHDRCGVIVASDRHAKALKTLGYPVVAWGQTVAFPMDSDVIAAMGTGEPHSGSLSVHSFFEPESLHNRQDRVTGNLTGDGTFGGMDHLAGAYIPTALALKCSMAGNTHVNLNTTNSALRKQEHAMKVRVDSNMKDIMCVDGTGGSILPDNHVVHAANPREGGPSLVVTKAVVRPGFEQLVQEMSGSKSSFSTKFIDKVSSTIGNGVFKKADMDLELEIRRYASSKVSLAAPLDPQQQGASSGPTEPADGGLHINLCDLSKQLQLDYSSSSMVGMQQPLPIAAPTVIVSSHVGTTDSSSSSDSTANAAASDSTEADLYGDHFGTTSFTLESHFKLEVGRDIHPFAGIVSLTHALFLGQISPAEAASICMPYARLDSSFRCCPHANCNCAALADAQDAQQAAPAGAAAAAPGARVEVSGRFERMLSGVSHHIALTNRAANLRSNSNNNNSRKSNSSIPTTGRDAAAAAAGGVHRVKAGSTSSVPCTALMYAGTCKCAECHNAARLISLAQRVCSCTRAFQKCDNYTSDQTVHAFNEQGVPQYTGTESMLPYGSIKSAMFREGPGGPDDVQMRIGMNTDDCENGAIQGKAIFDTLLIGSACVSRDHFHPPVAMATGAGVSGAASTRPSAQNAQSIAEDKEAVRLMRLDTHSKLDQRRILLCAEVLGEKVTVNLGFFITSAPSQSNDTNGQVSGHGSAFGTTSTASNAPPATGSSGLVVGLPASVGSGMQALGSKPLGRRLVHRTGASTEKDAAAAGPAYGGHCTNTLSVMRSDNEHMYVHITEGTGYVFNCPANIPFEVSHRGEVGAGDVANRNVGYCGGPINTDHAVDVTVKGLISSHLAAINAGMSVPGANMRPTMVLGDSQDIDENLDSFYSKLINIGGMQCVQAHGINDIKPGVDVKTFVNQKVHRILDLKTASEGHAAVHKKLDGATCGLIRVANPETADHRVFTKNCQAISQALSPLRLSIQTQDKSCLSLLGRLDSLIVNFPEDKQLKAKFGHAETFFVTHVVCNEEPTNYNKVLSAITAKARQKNSVYVNVRFAEPVQYASKEIMQFFRIYGAPKNPTGV